MEGGRREERKESWRGGTFKAEAKADRLRIVALRDFWPVHGSGSELRRMEPSYSIDTGKVCAEANSR
jgi:hypothetical protein